MNDHPADAVESTNRKISWPVVLLIGGILAAAVFAFYYWQSKPDPVQTTTSPPSVEAVAPAQSAAERGDSAREIIDDLRNATGPVDYQLAYNRAREFHASGRHADSQLLYFFAAKGGHAPALFDLATMYDPNYFSSADSLMNKPDSFQAYKWYREAQTAGDGRADQRLAELRTWAETQSKAGDASAERLMLQWE